MSNIGLFAAGVIVTLIVLAGLAPLVWAAIMDGRDENERRAAAEDASPRARQDPTPHAIDAA